MGKHVEVLPTMAGLIERALELVVAQMQSSISDRGQCTIALSGGSTPKPLYEAIANVDLPWQKIHVFWGDERYVAPDHPDSNQGMARRAWLDKVNIPAANIHPMPTLAGDPAVDASKHEAELREFFKTPPGEFPALDIILLGMGDDGPTASLFAHTEALLVS
ncbi:MAG TPA: 6-phosphogluconolactonase, partial [Cyanobacteria bacterium UBA11369]|nr:6-phosphogluconolactonase [Cyanobacteria bacterium UBA11369]